MFHRDLETNITSFAVDDILIIRELDGLIGVHDISHQKSKDFIL